MLLLALTPVLIRLVLVLATSPHEMLVLAASPHEMLILAASPHEMLVLAASPHEMLVLAASPHEMLVLVASPHEMLVLEYQTSSPAALSVLEATHTQNTKHNTQAHMYMCITPGTLRVKKQLDGLLVTHVTDVMQLAGRGLSYCPIYTYIPLSSAVTEDGKVMCMISQQPDISQSQVST